MKRIVCEMCGSSDLIKQDGVFVCQSCGTKYSVEEAKKMMVEGPIEVKNMAQADNLLKMAKSSFESKNYAKAEDFCNQVIAMDDKNYDAWKLKGEAINYQISASNPRILEVYNCIMTSYRTLGDVDAITDPTEKADKTIKKFEVLSSLKTCMEGEVEFWINRVEADRPTRSTINKAKNTFIDCYNKMKAAFEEMGFPDDTKRGYLKNFDNYFCMKVNSMCLSAWKTTVGYNYYRDFFNNLGANWNRNLNKNEYISSDYYRPAENTRKNFVEECDCLVDLLKFCEEQFNDTTLPKTKENVYANIAYLTRAPKDQVSYKAMVSTTTNGYGAVVSRSEYYTIDHYLTDSAKAYRENEAKTYDAKKEKAIVEGKERAERERKEKIQKYWEEHAEEKEALEKEKASLTTAIEQHEKEIETVDGMTEWKDLQQKIEELQEEKKSISIFKLKDRKAVQDKIDVLEAKASEVEEKVKAAQAIIQKQVDEKKARITEIVNEFEKNR